jgi:hypothetical protein
MARPKNANPSRKVEPSLPADAYACLQRLARMGRFGSNPTEVAKYLLTRSIDDLTRSGVLPSQPFDVEE